MNARQGARLLPGDEELPLPAALRLGLALDVAVELRHALGDVEVVLKEGFKAADRMAWLLRTVSGVMPDLNDGPEQPICGGSGI